MQSSALHMGGVARGAPHSSEPKECPRHFRLADLTIQVERLINAYPYLQADATLKFLESDEFLSLELPPGTHGWAAHPHSQAVCQHYETAVTTVIRKLGALNRNMSRPDSLYRNGRNSQGLLELNRWQPFDIQVVPVALGPTTHRGISIDERREHYWSREYPLGLFEGLNVLYTHQGRLMSDRDLGIIFSGDRLGGDTHPAVSFIGHGLVVDSVSVGLASKAFAEATWYMP